MYIDEWELGCCPLLNEHYPSDSPPARLCQVFYDALDMLGTDSDILEGIRTVQRAYGSIKQNATWYPDRDYRGGYKVIKLDQVPMEWLSSWIRNSSAFGKISDTVQDCELIIILAFVIAWRSLEKIRVGEPIENCEDDAHVAAHLLTQGEKWISDLAIDEMEKVIAENEDHTRRGLNIVKAAAAGGRAKADSLERLIEERNRIWQRDADEMWAKDHSLPKAEVGRKLRIRYINSGSKHLVASVQWISKNIKKT